MLATGVGGGGGGGVVCHLKKNFPDIPKNFSDISHFFLNMKNVSGYTKKFSRFMIFFRKQHKFKFSKVPFGQKVQS